MLEDVPGLISPIIQAMVANRNRQVQGQELQEKIRSNKAEEGLHAQQLAQAQAIADRQANLTQQQIDSENEIRKAQARGLATQNTMQALQLLKQGSPRNVVEGMMGMSLMQHLGQPGNQSPTAATGANPQQQVQSFFGQPGSYGQPQLQTQPQQSGGDPLDNIDWGAVRQNELNQLEQTEAAKSRGTAEGAAPIQAARDARQFQYQQALQQAGFSNDSAQRLAQQEFEHNENIAKMANDLKKSQLERNTQIAISNNENAVRMKLGQMEYGFTPEQGTARQIEIFSGQAKPTNSLQDRAIVAQGINSGMRLPGADVDELKTLQAVKPILDRFEAFANNLPKSSMGAIAQGLSRNTPIPTEAKNQLAEINSDLQNVGKALEGYSGGRILSKQFESEAGGVPTLGITRKQGLDRVNNLRQRVQEREQQILSTLPATQQDIIRNAYGITAAKGSTVKMKTPAGDILDIPASQVNEAKTRGAVEVK